MSHLALTVTSMKPKDVDLRRDRILLCFFLTKLITFTITKIIKSQSSH